MYVHDILKRGVAFDKLSKWSDQSLIYFDGDRAELFCFADVEVLHDYYSENIEYWAKVAIAVTLLGWRNNSSLGL
jgi:hypothetical protein